jgi:hypothetical protein
MIFSDKFSDQIILPDKISLLKLNLTDNLTDGGGGLTNGTKMLSFNGASPDSAPDFRGCCTARIFADSLEISENQHIFWTN